jgi:glutaredoxin 2
VTSRLKIYQFAHSPFCIAVTQAVRSVGIEPELVDVSNADRSAIVRLTDGAYYQVPVLADGERLVYESGSDSQDIAAYLDDVSAEALAEVEHDCSGKQSYSRKIRAGKQDFDDFRANLGLASWWQLLRYNEQVH